MTAMTMGHALALTNKATHPFTTMLLPLRSTAVRCLARYARTVSNAVSANDQSTINDAFNALGVAPTVPETPKPLATTSALMDIPPAEDPLLQYLTSSILNHGHRAKAARITSRMLLHIHAFTRAPPLPILQQAIFDAAPAVRTLMHKHGGKVVAKPIALSEKQRTRFAVKTILEVIKAKPGRLDEKLAREMIAIVQGTSPVIKKKLEIHRTAMVNRYVLYRKSALGYY